MALKTPTVIGRKATLASMLLAITVTVTACGGSSSSSAAATPPVAGAASVALATADTSGARATTVPQGNRPGGNLACQAIVNAAFDLNSSEAFLATLVGAGGSIQNRVDAPFYVDTAKQRADLAVLAALPDPTDASEISIMGKPSDAIAQFRLLLDMIDKAANTSSTAGSTPPAGSGATDQQLLGFTGKLIKMSTDINSAVGNSCPGVSANVPQAQMPGANATPLTASYHIGQTAPVGDLRVTLDRVVTLPGAGTILPTPGNQFVLAYFTVENTGKTASRQNMMTGTHWDGSGGKKYFFDPDTIMLDPNTTNLDGDLAAGAKKSGAVGYLVSTNPGDLVWVFEDSKPNRAVFAVKAGDITAVGTPVIEPTQDAMRAQAAATQTAFVEMALGAVSADATHEALGTDTPAPTDTSVPEVPTDTPVTEDTPVPAEPTDTVSVSP